MRLSTGLSENLSLPDLSGYGYELCSELGANRAGGRVTYLAKHIETQQLVVIKQFQFARSSANWMDYESLSQEIQVLKDLQHPGIPKYLGVFQAADGVCMIQEYKPAKSLAESRSFSPEAIRTIAIACLEILAYLQSRIPPIIHRDFKPANILVSDNLDVYLVDFGFARIGDGEVGVSSVVKGTLGFMPPEQIFNRQLTEASDLYGLGMTLICLLTNTPTDQVGTLVDITYQVDFKKLKADLSPRWVKWLGKMVEPRLSNRFANARAALDTIPEHGLRQPDVRASQAKLDLTSQARGELLTTTLTLTNSVLDTTLAGNWQVAPHAQDPKPNRGDSHSWIRFIPETFQGNDVTTQIQIDTSKLMTGQTYERTLQLKTNAHPSIYSFNLTLRTAPLPFRTQGIPYPLLLGLLIACGITVWVLTSLAPEYTARPEVINTLSILTLFGSGLGWEIAGWLLHEASLDSPAARIVMIVGTGIVTLVAPICLWFDIVAIDGITSAVTIGLGMFGSSLLGLMAGLTMNRLWLRGFKPKFAIGLSLLTTLLGTGIGLSQGLVLSSPLITFGLLANLVGIGTMLVYLPIQRAQAIAHYRRHVERCLIRP
ncbi:MAG: serine/threonine-protein kinase [Cyanobacteria bacterium P01_B01_bin.77]